uniref:Retrotransposon gag domain-containing protein n=1 Tax=Nicotiana tabacum TaxID=4097 RepID=A0A1S3YPK5_TOBAC|nr:PREDICTED: uncharacterized protein LOC107778223 [Nicotiana tabacum]
MDQIPGTPPVLKGPESKKYTQLPFKPSVSPELIPKWFKMPDIPKYDGTSDPQEHVTTYTNNNNNLVHVAQYTTYTTAVKGNNLDQYEIESVLLKIFGDALTKWALTWYSLLPEHSIDSFEMLIDSFIKAHAGARKVQARKANIFRIAQGESKLLREFVIRFYKERMLVPIVPNEWAVEAFTKDLRSSKDRLLPYERAEGRSSKGFQSSDRFAPDRRTDRDQNNRSLQEKEVPGTQDSSYPRLSDYNFNIRVVELVSAMRNIKEARFPRPIRSDPS